MLQFPNILSQTQFQDQINHIVGLSTALKHLPIDSQKQQHLFHTQLLKSSLFSARIEGNQLTLVQAKKLNLSNPKEKNAVELSNINHVLEKIGQLPQTITRQSLLQIHEQLMTSLDNQTGKLRGESSAIFDQYGNVIYLTPEPQEMKQMLDVLLKKLNQHTEPIAQQLLKIAQCHYYFEKIHPFMDGNGRTGRILIHWQLHQIGLVGEYILPVEQYFDDHKHQYYTFLEKNSRKITEFVDFFLSALEWSLQNTLDQVKKSQDKPVTSLLPRREEIVYIIEDHPYSSSDMISRRFPTVSKRTIINDLNYLVRKNHIRKHGETRGARYSANNLKVE